MKLIRLLSVVLVAIAFASCSKKTTDDPIPVPLPEDQAELTISFTGDAISKVAGAADAAADKKINDYSVFVFDEDGKFNATVGERKWFEVLESTTDITALITASITAREVYIVANVGNEDAHTTMFSSVTNKTTLLGLAKDRIIDLYNETNAAGKTDIRAADVLMTGVPEVTVNGGKIAWVGEDTATPTGSITVTMSVPITKINLTVDDNRINNTGVPEGGTPYKIVSVAKNIVIINAGKKVRFFGNDSSQDDFYTGLNDGIGAQGVGVAKHSPYFINTVQDQDITDWTTNGGTVVTHHFYTAANDGVFVDNDGSNKPSPTILAIQAEETYWDATAEPAATATRTVYYPIQFTATDAEGNTLQPGKSYNVKLTLTGNLENGEGAGITDPEKPFTEEGTLDAAITVASWGAIDDVGQSFE